MTPTPRAAGRRHAIGWGLVLAALAGTVALGVQPAPYVIEEPGPVFDTIGDVDGEPLLTVDGAPTYPTEGELDLLTVHITGSPQSPATWIDVARAWFDARRAIVPLEAVYPPGQTDEEADQESQAEMTDSQQEAVAAALTELGTPYQVRMSVGSVIDDGPSAGVLQPGDELVSLDGRALADLADLRDAIAAHGTSSPAEVGIRRDGVARTESITPVDSDGVLVIGVTVAADYDFPVDVTVSLDGVGGPSAGMMLALGVYDLLTPGALTGGEHIAGTGTIASDGEVGPIGGIRQKMYGAVEDGATWFLAPSTNCDEVVGHVPDGLRVVRVDTLDEALAAVQGIARGETQDLPGCGSVG